MLAKPHSPPRSTFPESSPPLTALHPIATTSTSSLIHSPDLKRPAHAETEKKLTRTEPRSRGAPPKLRELAIDRSRHTTSHDHPHLSVTRLRAHLKRRKQQTAAS
ncbi:hypothetical protein KC19_4G148800 [Ceratodon purpureus]|uniref:Uncharacterized protein n=1 Tax=Ceratodon purpureus TaxID=3225 RepID=A0A8T0IAU6_CERPU|nr:hypothetical protein KC19_4G148800 [Ceratodon purpureus]